MCESETSTRNKIEIRTNSERRANLEGALAATYSARSKTSPKAIHSSGYSTRVNEMLLKFHQGVP